MAEIIEGMDEFTANLRKLEVSLQRKVLIEVCKVGGEIVKREASARAPKRTGELARRMTMKVSGRDSDINEASVDVGPDRKQFYGYFQEKGTEKMRAHAFLEPAFEAKKEAMSTAMQLMMLHIIDDIGG